MTRPQGDITWTLRSAAQPGRCGGSLRSIPDDVQSADPRRRHRAPTGGNAQNGGSSSSTTRRSRPDRSDLPAVHRRPLGGLLRRPCRGGRGRSRQRRLEDLRQGAALCAVARRQLRDLPTAPLLVRPARSHRWIDLPGDLERNARGPRRGSRQLVDQRPALRERHVLDVLGVPSGEGWLVSSCVTFGYPTGRWGVAARRPAHEVAYRNRWGTDVGLSIDAPVARPDVPPR